MTNSFMSPQADEKPCVGEQENRNGTTSPSIGSDNEGNNDLVIDMEAENSRYITRSNPNSSTSQTDDIKDESMKSNGKKRKYASASKRANKKLKTTDSEPPPTSTIHMESEENQVAENTEVDSRNKEQTCPKCQEIFHDPHSFTIHIRKHNPDDTTCGICFKKLSSASSRDRHILTHSGERPFQCKHCKVKFTTNGNMNRHMQNCSNSGKKNQGSPGSECKKSQTPGSPIESHPTKEKPPKTSPSSSKPARLNEDVIGKSEKDSAFSLGFPQLSHIAFSYHNFRSISSKVCDDTFREDSERNSKKSYEKKLELKCKHCTKILPSEHSLLWHKNCHNIVRTICDQCQGYFKSEEHLEAHKSDYHCHDENLKKLEFSDKEFERQKAFLGCLGLRKKNFTLMEDKENKTDKERMSIKLYNMKISRALQRSFSSPKIEPIVDQDGNGETSRAEVLVTNNHDPSTPVSLKKQDVTLSEPESPVIGTEEHLIAEDRINSNSFEQTNTHDLWGNSVCCSTRENNADTILEESAACGVKMSKPSAADDSENSHDFADISSILSNVAAPVQSESSDPEECKSSLSGASFTDSNNENAPKGYVSKMKKVAKKNGTRTKKKLQCQHCNYTTCDKSSMSRHMIRHKKIHPYRCLECGKKFTMKSNGERHAKKKHHLRKDEVFGIIDYNPEEFNSEHMIVCKYCHRRFTSNQALQHHLRSSKNSCQEKPFICGKCRIGCSSKNNCIRHIMKKHNLLLEHLSPEESEKKKEELIIVNKSKKSMPMKESQVSASSDEACESMYESQASIFEVSTLLSQQRPGSSYLVSEDDINAAVGLVNLSEGLPELAHRSYTAVQLFPLDLSQRALDLTANKMPLQVQTCINKSASEESNSSLVSQFSSSSSDVINHVPSDLSKRSRFLKSTSTNMSTPLPTRNHSSSPGFIIMHESVLLQDDTASISHKYKCGICPKTFTENSNRKRHVRKAHPQFAEPLRRNITRGNESFKQCQSVLSNKTREALVNRVMQNTDNNRHVELEEQQKLDTITKNELVSAHEGEMNSDLENVDLASVSSVIHTANSPKFNQFLTDDSNVSNKTQVDYGSGSDSGSSSENSNKIGTGYTSNNHACSDCDKSFAWKSGLKRHSVHHTGERNYVCPKCKRRFGTNSNLTRHFKTHGSEREDIPVRQKKRERGPESPAQDTLFQSKNIKPSSGTSFEVIPNSQHLEALAMPCLTPEINGRSTSPMRSQESIPHCEEQDKSMAALECRFCKDTFKMNNDLLNHMKELHPLDYGSSLENTEIPTAVGLNFWKKDRLNKFKR